jgi:MurNAc alpha-1-phosphate uridylyltransferase
MKAVLLAAGRGERMRPLTDTCPKPLLQVRGKALIEWHLEALARGGVREVVINTAWLEAQIVAALGDGARYGLRITYSMEGRDHGGALETGGGLKKALPLLLDPTEGTDSEAAFWYVAADVFAPQFEFEPRAVHDFERSGELARLWMVPNPPQHPLGDFGIDAGKVVPGVERQRWTWGAIGLFRPAFVTGLLHDVAPGVKARLRPALDGAIAQRRVGAVRYDGPWFDVGTPERLAALQSPAGGDRAG